MATRTARSRRRFARALEQVREQRDRVAKARTAEERLSATKTLIEQLWEIAGSTVPLWPLAEEAGLLDGKENFDTRALIAQIVGASLPRMTPRSARKQHTKSQVSALTAPELEPHPQ